MTELIFFDIDDTLSRKGNIASFHIPLLKSLSAQGIKLVIATGRGRAMLPKDVMALFYEGILDAIICMNGQYSFTQAHKQSNYADNIISHYPLSSKQAQTMVDICKRNDVIYKFDSSQFIGWGQNSKLSKMTANNPHFIVAPDFFKHNDVYQCSVFFKEGDKNKDLNTNLCELDLKLVHWHSTGGDLLPNQASKARGVKDVCAHFNIDIQNTIAFGDGMNDIEMFQVVGTSVAMGDAKLELKEQASLVTGTIEKLGIQRALEKLGVLPE